MNVILNRNFELPGDGWYQLAPLGEFPHGGAGINQVIDADACTRMVAAFENSRSQSENFPGLLIDFDHFSLDAEKHSEAAGWIVGLEYRGPAAPNPDLPARVATDNLRLQIETEGNGSFRNAESPGLYAKIRWSDTGEAAVKGGRYRFLSPVWAKADCEDLGENRLRPVRLLNAAVTNDPNLKGILPPSNRSGSPSVSLVSSVVKNNPAKSPPISVHRCPLAVQNPDFLVVV